MPVPSANPQDAHAAITFLIIIGSLICVRYWRTALVAVVVAAIALAIYGTIVGADVVTSVMSSHHK
jgi:hypothetical protein